MAIAQCSKLYANIIVLFKHSFANKESTIFLKRKFTYLQHRTTAKRRSNEKKILYIKRINFFINNIATPLLISEPKTFMAINNDKDRGEKIRRGHKSTSTATESQASMK